MNLDVVKCLGRIAELAHSSPAEIATGAVDALVGIEGVAGAGLLQANGRAVLMARAGEGAEGRAALAALARPDLPRDEWLRAEGHEWLWVDASAEEPRLALLARLTERTPAPEFLKELSTAARVLLAVYSTARQREAAIRILSTDVETGLASRAYFDRYLAALCRRAAAQQTEAALVLVSPTDAAALKGRLQALAALLREHLGAAKVARVAQDVVGAVVTGQGAAALKGQLRVLAAALDRTETVAAVGAAAFPWHASDGTGLLRAAETALRASRNNGDVPVVAGALGSRPE